jgi:hypothetical protein
MSSSNPATAGRASARGGTFLNLLLAAWIVSLATGCGGAGRPPKELSPAEIPPAVERAFQHAGDELRQAATELVEAVESGEDSRAYLQLQRLLNRPDLSGEQRDVVSRSMMSIGARLTEAAEAGDAAATRLMETHGAFK